MSHAAVRKIINDPVYGFITIDHPLVYKILSHPWYQRLRRIHQMALAQLVYPGAIHTRFHHSLGAYHLMCNALQELRSKGVSISAEEEVGAKIAILLHDAGHGPYSHALENVLVEGVHHETISLLIMRSLNQALEGRLDPAIAIFTNNYPKPYLHQLISGQLDVDRMDYLSRDSFFTGVSEGVIAYDRILKMLTVHNNHLMIEEKGIYSIEKFLVARRLMYWQVYLHKTVLSAEKMLVKIMQRAKALVARGCPVPAASPMLQFFLQSTLPQEPLHEHLDQFCALDDYDVLTSVKNWMAHEDKILSVLSRSLIERRLFKVRFQTEPFTREDVLHARNMVCEQIRITEEEADYFVLEGEAQNTTYDPRDERINILFKDGQVKDISQVDNALIHRNLSSPVKKYYICYMEC
ncbi:MAG: HD domain-containing protein [Williamsia sp.]|nr:HD domain-containing protein [Williamsia sp.]